MTTNKELLAWLKKLAGFKKCDICQKDKYRISDLYDMICRECWIKMGKRYKRSLRKK